MSLKNFFHLLTILPSGIGKELSGRAPTLIGVLFQGRLGNQMFQYAAARCAAETLGEDLLLIAQRPSGQLQRLTRPIQVDLLGSFSGVTASPLARGIHVLRGLSEHAFQRALRRLLPHRFAPRRVVSGGLLASEAFDPAVRNVAPGTLLVGFFQSEAYFADHAAAVRTWFRPTANIMARVDEMIASVRANLDRYVAVHARLGDYADHFFCVGDRTYPYMLGADFYTAALDHFPEDVPIALFSDDPDRARAFLPRSPDWVCPAAGPAETLIAMTRFRRIIIANSSFSWWAAWLGGPCNDVVAPLFHMGRAAGVWYPSNVAVQRWRYV